MTKEKMIEKLAQELGNRDREDLCKVVSTKKFEEAFIDLDGYNLTCEPITINGQEFGNNTFFDLNYKSIATTIFKTPNGNCEVYECVDVWLDDLSSPILMNVIV